MDGAGILIRLMDIPLLVPSMGAVSYARRA
jgi:hypothetical protein